MKRPVWAITILIPFIFAFGKEAPPPPLQPSVGVTEAGHFCLVATRGSKTIATKISKKLDWSLSPSECSAKASALEKPDLWIENPNGVKQGYCDKEGECGSLRVQPDDMRFMPAKKQRRVRMRFNGKTSTLMTLKNFVAGAVETKVYESSDQQHRVITMFVRYGRSMCPPSMHEVIVWVDKDGRKQWLYEGFMNVEHELTESPNMERVFERE